MRAVLAICIAGAMTFAGVIWLVGGSRPGTTVLDASPAAVSRTVGASRYPDPATAR